MNEDYKVIDGKPYFSGNYVLKREKEIERLQQMLEDKFQKQYPFIVENGIICYKNEEIKRLKQKAQDDYENYQEIMSQVLEQKGRLNNIINELEKWLKENNERLHKALGRKCVTQESYEEVLDKIKELKGSDKE